MRFLKLILALLFSFQSLITSAQCNIPDLPDDVLPPSYFHYETISSGEWSDPSVWKNGSVPSLTIPKNTKVKISDSVLITTGSIDLESSTLYLEDAHLTLKNGGIDLSKKDALFIAERSELLVSGNFTLSNKTKLYAHHAELHIGDPGDKNGNATFYSGTGPTSSNFVNNGGYRRLRKVCICLTGNYENQGTDELIDICSKTGLINPLDSVNPIGQGAGNFINNRGGDMKIYDSEIFLPNGNLQNSESLATCDTRFRLTNGNTENKSSSNWNGEGLVLWVAGETPHNLNNSGTWDVDVAGLCVNGTIQGAFENPLPEEMCSTIANLFDTAYCTPVPVTWMSVTAVRIGHHEVQLNWSTAAELNNAYFTLERMEDGGFVEVDRVDGAGTRLTATKYEFMDLSASTVETSYRIKQTDFDGQFSYSKIVTVAGLFLGHHVMIYPNPTDGEFTICWDPSHHNTLRVELVDLTGNVVFSEEVLETTNFHKESLQHLRSGMYIINLYTGDGLVHRNRLIKQ